MKRLYLSLVEEIVGSEGRVYDLGNVFVAECSDGFWRCEKDAEFKCDFNEDEVVWSPAYVSEIERCKKQDEDEGNKIVLAEMKDRDSVNDWNVTERDMIASGMRDGRIESMAGSFDEVIVYQSRYSDSDLYAGLHKGFTI